MSLICNLLGRHLPHNAAGPPIPRTNKARLSRGGPFLCQAIRVAYKKGPMQFAWDLCICIGMQRNYSAVAVSSAGSSVFDSSAGVSESASG